MSAKFKKVKEIVASIEADVEKFYDKDNQAAGTRVRKAMQDLKVLAQDIRKEVQEIKNKKAASKAKSGGAKKASGGKSTAKSGGKKK
ncbi:Histone H1-like protein Hc1 [Raineya orbicola]|jgi:archaellum component FlaC|uniref:Histone H1-like protein Hc1 n=1 Tax=Raineya orbicola TaxID=2016530 RepID=A0A2N3IBW7_9BACT|nr:Histone H1-like protein Hc1 [Raineya orbicola]